MENNYYRITAYHPEKDISIIMDSFGLFEKKWQFSADLIKKGFKIIEVSDDSQFTEGNIPLLVEPSDKYILRAYATGKPNFVGTKVTVDDNFRYCVWKITSFYNHSILVRSIKISITAKTHSS